MLLQAVSSLAQYLRHTEMPVFSVLGIALKRLPPVPFTSALCFPRLPKLVIALLRVNQLTLASFTILAQQHPHGLLLQLSQYTSASKSHYFGNTFPYLRPCDFYVFTVTQTLFIVGTTLPPTLPFRGISSKT